MTIEQQALALVNEGNPGCYVNLSDAPHVVLIRALRTALERHEADKAAWKAQDEAFRQEVSEAVKKEYGGEGRGPFTVPTSLARFIIAPPVDPKIEAYLDHCDGACSPEEAAKYVADYEAALAKHGLAITGVE